MSDLRRLNLKGPSGQVILVLSKEEYDMITTDASVVNMLYQVLENGGEIDGYFKGPCVTIFSSDWKPKENEVFPDDLEEPQNETPNDDPHDRSLGRKEQGTSNDEDTCKLSTSGKGHGYWSYEECLLLIEQYRENQDRFKMSGIPNTAIWSQISGVFKSNGHTKSAALCEKKWNNMRIRYRAINDANRKSGNNRSPWPYFKKMAEVMENDPAVAPVATVSSHSSEDNSTDVTTVGKRKSDNADEIQTKKSKRLARPDWVLDLIAEQRAENETRRKEFQEFREEFLKTQREKNNILQSLVDHLKK